MRPMNTATEDWNGLGVPKGSYDAAVPHRCPSQIQMRRALRLRGLPMHGATMPLALSKFLVQYFTKRGDLVCDPTAGWFTSALAAEKSHCRWIATDHMLEYVAGSQLRFNQAPGFNSMIELPSP